MEANDADGTMEGNGSGATGNSLVTTSQPSWPPETDIQVTGNKVLLSQQSQLLQDIFRTAFDNVRKSLVSSHAFPDAIILPRMLRVSVSAGTKAHIFVDGCYNASASYIKQRILSDVDYEAKIIHLVSNIPLLMIKLIE